MEKRDMRKAYLEGTITHEDFYRAVYLGAGLQAPDHWMLRDTATALRDGDDALNSIPLPKWDQKASGPLFQLRRAFEEQGDFYSLAGGVCAFKQLYKDAVTAHKDATCERLEEVARKYDQNAKTAPDWDTGRHLNIALKLRDTIKVIQG